MILKNTIVFLIVLLRGVWLHCKKLCFEYHGLIVTMVFLEYLKLNSNPKFFTMTNFWLMDTKYHDLKCRCIVWSDVQNTTVMP